MSGIRQAFGFRERKRTDAGGKVKAQGNEEETGKRRGLAGTTRKVKARG